MPTPDRPAWFNARPPFLIAGGVMLLAFGAIFGVALDLATQETPKYVAAPRRAAVALDLPEAPGATVIARPQGQPVRAWAPDVGPSPAPTPAPKEIPLLAYAVASPAPQRVPVIAVVIDDMGLDRARTQRVLGLHGPLTLSLMTYAEGLTGLVSSAKRAGHEVMAHVPMEPQDRKEDPGPGALTIAMDDAAIRRQIAADLDPWTGYVGINNHMGSRFTADKARMSIVMSELKTRGLLWLDSKTTQETVGPSAARTAGVPFVERDVFLDNVETVEAVTSQLQLAESLARSRGTAIAIGHPHEATIMALQTWLPKLEGRGVAIVPITEILKRRSETKDNAAAPG